MRVAGGSPSTSTRLSRARLADAAALALLVFLALPAALPLFRPGIPDANDSLDHLAVLVDFDYALRGGQPFPRWLPDYGLAHGATTTAYYSPAAYFLAEALHLAGLSFPMALNATLALGLLLSGVAMYPLARAVTGHRGAALAAGVAYIYFPYHLTDIYTRGAIGDAAAAPLLPPLLWALYRVARGEGRRYLIWAAALFAALIFSHEITAFLAAPVALAFAAWVAWRTPSVAPVSRPALLPLLLALARTLAALALGLALSGFYSLPTLLELDLTHVRGMVQGGMGVLSHLTPLEGLVQYRWAFDHLNLQYRLGLVQLLAALLALLVTWSGWGLAARGPASPHLGLWTLDFGLRSITPLLVGACVLALLLMSNPALPFWRALPALQFVQFPWRLLMFLGLATSLLMAHFALVGRWSLVAAPVALAALVLASLWDLPAGRLLTDGAPLTPGTVARFAYGRGPDGAGGPSQEDWLPRWVDKGFIKLADGRPFDLGAEPAPPLGEVTIGAWGQTRRELTVALERASVLRLHSFYYPSWKASVDGRETWTYPSTRAGLLTLDVPAGPHRVAIWLGLTRAALGGQVLTWIALALALAVLSPKSIVQSPKPRLVWALVPLPIALLWYGALAVLAPRPAPVADFAGDHPPGVVAYSSASLLARATLPTTLYRVSGPTPPSIGFELVGRGGRPVASSGAAPVLGVSPPATWAPNEVVDDRRELALPPGQPPGEFQLRLRVADSARELAPVRLPAVPATPLPGQRPLNAGFDGKLELLEYFLWTEEDFWRPRRPAVPPGSAEIGLRGGQYLGVALRWRPMAAMRENQTVFVHLIDSPGRQWAGQDNQPGGGLRPTSSWLPGEEVDDRYLLRLPRELPAGLYRLEVGLYQLASGHRLPLAGGGSSLVFSAIKAPLPGPDRAPSLPLDIAFEQRVRLAGYDLDPSPPRPGAPLRVTLHWRASAPLAVDETAFVQLLDGGGRLVAQSDAKPAGGNYPTTVWGPGEGIADSHTLALPAGLPPGRYRLIAGLYDPAGSRLPLLSGGDAAVLGEVELR